MAKDIHDVKECPDCASPELIYNERRQQVVCKDCGLIYAELTPKEEATYTGPSSTKKPAHLSRKKSANKRRR